jgi:hypothetical protein
MGSRVFNRVDDLAEGSSLCGGNLSARWQAQPSSRRAMRARRSVRALCYRRRFARAGGGAVTPC